MHAHPGRENVPTRMDSETGEGLGVRFAGMLEGQLEPSLSLLALLQVQHSVCVQQFGRELPYYSWAVNST